MTWSARDDQPRYGEGNGGKGGEGSSLDRLAEFTRRIVTVPKDRIPKHKPKRRRKTRKRAR